MSKTVFEIFDDTLKDMIGKYLHSPQELYLNSHEEYSKKYPRQKIKDIKMLSAENNIIQIKFEDSKVSKCYSIPYFCKMSIENKPY